MVCVKNMLFWKFVALITLFNTSIPLSAQKKSDLYGSWVRVKTIKYNESVSKNIIVNEEDYLRLRFIQKNELIIFGSYLASGTKVKYELDNDMLTFGFDRKFKVELGIDDSQLILVELDDVGQLTSDSLKHIYLREDVFLDKLPISPDDSFLHNEDTIYFASKKLYPEYQPYKYPDFHLYVHNQLKPFYQYGSNHFYATFVVYPDGTVGEVDILHHVNKASDRRALKAIVNSKGRWISPLLQKQKAPVLMHIEDRYTLGEENHTERLNLGLNTNAQESNENRLYSANLYKIGLAFRKGEYQKALEYIQACEEVFPEAPNLVYLKYRCYKSLESFKLSEECLKALKDTKLRYLTK